MGERRHTPEWFTGGWLKRSNSMSLSLKQNLRELLVLSSGECRYCAILSAILYKQISVRLYSMSHWICIVCIVKCRYYTQKCLSVDVLLCITSNTQLRYVNVFPTDLHFHWKSTPFSTVTLRLFPTVDGSTVDTNCAFNHINDKT